MDWLFTASILSPTFSFPQRSAGLPSMMRPILWGTAVGGFKHNALQVKTCSAAADWRITPVSAHIHRSLTAYVSVALILLFTPSLRKASKFSFSFLFFHVCVGDALMLMAAYQRCVWLTYRGRACIIQEIEWELLHFSLRHDLFLYLSLALILTLNWVDLVVYTSKSFHTGFSAHYAEERMTDDAQAFTWLHKTTSKTIAGLTVGGGRLGPVERADYDESEAFALLSVDDDITGLCVGRQSVWRGRGVAGVGCLGIDGAVAICEVTAGGAVLRGDRARASAVLRTGLTCRRRQRVEKYISPVLIPSIHPPFYLRLVAGSSAKQSGLDVPSPQQRFPAPPPEVFPGQMRYILIPPACSGSKPPRGGAQEATMISCLDHFNWLLRWALSSTYPSFFRSLTKAHEKLWAGMYCRSIQQQKYKLAES